MNLIIENRTDQFATLNFTKPDGSRGVCNLRPRAESAIPIPSDDALTHMLDELSRFGVVAAEGIDAMNAATVPYAPDWRGFCYRVDGTA